MLWECEKGHQWATRWDAIKHSESWCPECYYASRRGSIDELHQYAASKNGKLLFPDEFHNSRSLVTWECEKGHQWKTCFDSIKRDHWCRICAGGVPDIETLHEHAKSKNGRLLSTEYKNAWVKLLWECEKGHQWKACWHSIKSDNTWCPHCSAFKTERLCKELLEQKLEFNLPKTRVYYDEDNKRRYYEWDGYNKEHSIAFEYHGYQHYVYPNFWHRTREAFEQGKQRDTDKEKYAEEHGIRLIIIPYTEMTNLETYINTLLKQI